MSDAALIKSKIMKFVRNKKIRDRIISEGKVAVYLDEDGDFIIEEDKTGIINRIPHDRTIPKSKNIKNPGKLPLIALSWLG